MNLKEQAKQAFFWDFLGKILKNSSGFIVTIFLARLLDPKDFGLIAIAAVFIGIVGVFTNIGLSGALVQRRKVLDIHYSSVFYFNIFMGMILAIIIYNLAQYIADFYKNQKLILIIQILSFSFVLNTFSNIQSTILQKNLQYKIIAKFSLISSIISGIIGVILAFNSFGVWSLVIMSFVGSFVNNFLLWKNSRWRPSFNFSFKALRQLWTFGFSFFLSVLLERIYQKFDYIIIGKIFDTSTLGFFQRAKSFNEFIVRYSSQSIKSVLFPILSKVQKDKSRFQKIVKKVFSILVFTSLFFTGLFYTIGEELILILFGSKWKESIEIFKILILSSFGYPLSSLLGNILNSRGNSKAFLKLEVYKKILAFSNFYILYYMGMKYFLYGLIVVSFLGLILNIYFAIKEIDLFWKDFLYPIIIQISFSIISILLLSSILYFIKIYLFFTLIVKVVLFSGFYILLNYFFNKEIIIIILDEIKFNKLKKILQK